MQMTKHPRVGVACRETCEELGALLSAEMKCPPHEMGQALANPSPQGEGSQNSCPLSIRERARVRVKSVLQRSIQQRQIGEVNNPKVEAIGLTRMLQYLNNHYESQ